MTVFCWHLTAAFLVAGAVLGLGVDLPSAMSPQWWALAPAWALACSAVLVVLVLALRGGERWPVLGATGGAAGAGGPAGAAGTAEAAGTAGAGPGRSVRAAVTTAVATVVVAAACVVLARTGLDDPWSVLPVGIALALGVRTLRSRGAGPAGH